MTSCDSEQLKRLLDESLPEITERDIAEHVASCPECQLELETLAAGKIWWSEAQQRLSKSSLVKTPGIATAGDKDDCLAHDDTMHFANDFAVDFLEPCDDATRLGRLGDYEIEAVIGRGGMGIVLKGFQAELNRYVAIKVLAPHLASSGAARRRFAREAQATAAIVHPHVMAIHSVHANVKLPYLVMPFVACESLQDRLDTLGPLEVSDILRIGMQAALGLAAAHAQGLVHRDVKPANILLETTVDRVMLTDFGLARAVDDATLTRTGVIAGTPQYMSPEQANGDAIDLRSDLFSLGGVLYAMCTGRPPFRAETTFGVLRRIREASPRPIREINADIPDWLERIVMRLLAKDAADRNPSADQVAGLLERCLAHVQQPMTTALPEELNHPDSFIAQKQPVPRRFARIGIAISVVVVIAVFAMAPRGWFLSPRPTNDHQFTASSTNESDVGTTDPRLQWDSLRAELSETETLFEAMEMSGNQALEALAADRSASLNSDQVKP